MLADKYRFSFAKRLTVVSGGPDCGLDKGATTPDA
jgi:hypothetical protein